MLNPVHFREHVIRPTLKHLDLWSESAENLLLGTALVESGLTYLVQLGDGPALGVYQMEPLTHIDIWENFLVYRENIDLTVRQLVPGTAYVRRWTPANPPEEDLLIPVSQQLITNLAYATAMARIHYLRDPHRLPEADDVWGMGRYYKRVWNSELGKGSAAGYVQVWSTVMEGWDGR